MKKRVSILVSAACLAVLSVVRAGFIVPESPVGAQTDFAGWDTFTDPFTDFQLPEVGETVGPFPEGEGNIPNDPYSSNFDARLIQNGPEEGTVISGSGGIYSISGLPTRFLIVDRPAFEADSVLLQVQTLGTMADLEGAQLFYRETENGVLHAAEAPTGKGFLQKKGNFFSMWEWDLSEVMVFDFYIVFGSDERMLSLQGVQLDTFEQKTTNLGVALKIETSSMFVTVGEVEHNLVGETEPSVTYQIGDQVELRAVPVPTYDHEFVGWYGDVSGNENPVILTITESPNVKAVFAPRSYSNWIYNRVNPYLTVPPYLERSAWDADSDGDGLINLLEYALGGLPEEVDAAEVQPRMEFSDGGAPRFDFRRQIAATDLTYRVLVSDDLVNWHFNGDGSGITYTEELPDPVFNGDGTETVGIRPVPGVFPSGNRLFFRVEVIH